MAEPGEAADRGHHKARPAAANRERGEVISRQRGGDEPGGDEWPRPATEAAR